MLAKLLNMFEATSQSTNITINNSNSGPPLNSYSTNQSTQTDLVTPAPKKTQDRTASQVQEEGTCNNCSDCNIIFGTLDELEVHNAEQHNEDVLMDHQSSQEPSQTPATAPDQVFFTCDFCSMKHTTPSELLEHKETQHATEFISCHICKYRCQSKTHLDDHIKNSHQVDSNPGPPASCSQSQPSPSL